MPRYIADGNGGTCSSVIDFANDDRPGAYDVTQVNQMTPVQAFRWYNTHGFLALPAHPSEKKLAGPGGYHFDTLKPLSEADIANGERNWQPGWRLALVMSKASRMV